MTDIIIVEFHIGKTLDEMKLDHFVKIDFPNEAIGLFRKLEDDSDYKMSDEKLQHFSIDTKIGNFTLLEFPLEWAEYADSLNNMYRKVYVYHDGIELNQFRNEELRWSYYQDLQKYAKAVRNQEALKFISKDLQDLNHIMFDTTIDRELQEPLTTNKVIKETLKID